MDLVADAFTPEQWAQSPTAALDGAAGQGDRGLASKLVMGAGAKIGVALLDAVRGGHKEIVDDLLGNGASTSSKQLP